MFYSYGLHGLEQTLSNLGIYIVESGDAGSSSEFYLLTLVFHDQEHPIHDQTLELSRKLEQIRMPRDLCIHAGSIVRKERGWNGDDLSFRRKVFSAMFHFVRLCPISYKTFVVKKSECANRSVLRGKLARELALFFRDHREFFQGFDDVFVYYNNSQTFVGDMANNVLRACIPRVRTCEIEPWDFRLNQAASMLCTLELLGQKDKERCLSRSELRFFGNRRALVKNFLKPMKQLLFKR